MFRNKIKNSSNLDSNLKGIAYERTFFALGTKNSIKIFGEKNDKALEAAINRVLDIEKRMSAYDKESDISRIRNSGVKVYTSVHKDTYKLVRKSIRFAKSSMGAFDITIRPLIELWGINKKGDFIPNKNEIKDVLELIDYNDISFRPWNKSIALSKEGQAIDLGGIAKGYAADEVKRIIKKYGVKSAVINLGGNIITLGAREDGTPFNIGIQNPLAKTGDIIGTVAVSNKTIVTSGSNERFFIKDGIRYHHILCPRTGMPAKSGLLSITVVCKSSVEADALTTAAFVLGMEKGRQLIKKKKAEAIFIHEDLSVFVTSGLKDSFKIEGKK